MLALPEQSGQPCHAAAVLSDPDPPQFRGIEVAAGHDRDDALAGERCGFSFTAAASDAAPAPSARLCVARKRQAHAFGELLFAERHDIVELALENPERADRT